jgi:hypothetical protein
MDGGLGSEHRAAPWAFSGLGPAPSLFHSPSRAGIVLPGAPTTPRPHRAHVRQHPGDGADGALACLRPLIDAGGAAASLLAVGRLT